MVCKKNNIPTYLYVQDLWPENVEVVTGIQSKFIIGSISKMVDYIYKNTDRILTISESFVQSIIDRDVSEEKVLYWPQYAEDFYRPVYDVHKSFIPDDGRFNIVFTGNIGKAQGLDLLPRVAKILKTEGYEDKIFFNMIGDGRYKETLKETIYSNKVEHMFNFIDRQPPEEIPYFISSCDAAFLSFSNEKLFNMTIPAKLQSYLACGIPILASAGGETKKIIDESQAGFCTETGDEVKMAESIMKFTTLNHKERKIAGEKARLYYEDNFDKETLLNKMDKLFK